MIINCSLFNSTEEGDFQENVILNIRVVMAVFSLIGSLFVIGLIWLFKKYTFFVQRLIFYLSVSAFLSSTAYIMGRFDYNPNSKASGMFCVFQGYWLLYTDWTVLASVFCIMFNVFYTVFTENRLRWIEFVYFVLIFILPAAISAIPFYNDYFGPSGAWCWIRSKDINCTEDSVGTAIQFGVWYIPQALAIFMMFIMYFIVIIKLTIKVRSWHGTFDPQVDRERQSLKQEIKPLLFYPTVYFIVCIFPLINRVMSNVFGHTLFALYVLHVLCSPLQGALTALTYTLDKQTLRKLRWPVIKANLCLRDSVREYPVGHNDERESLIKSAN